MLLSIRSQFRELLSVALPAPPVSALSSWSKVTSSWSLNSPNYGHKISWIETASRNLPNVSSRKKTTIRANEGSIALPEAQENDHAEGQAVPLSESELPQ